MSTHHEIFAAVDDGVPAVIERVLGTAAHLQGPPGGDVLYTVDFDEAFVDVAVSHDYDDDQGIEFSRYPLVLTIRDRASDRRREEATARRIFGELRATGVSRACLVYNLQTKLDEFQSVESRPDFTPAAARACGGSAGH